MRFRFGIVPALAGVMVMSAGLEGAEKVLPRPDGKPADMSKPVQVYILMGQSNMLGFGKPSRLQGVAAEKYPYLVDDAGQWTVRKDVRNVFVMCSGNSAAKDRKNEWMTISGNIGPEIGIGHHVGHVTDAPVLILKSCIGNRSLGWDLLPPGSEAYEHNGKLQPGYRGTPKEPRGDTGGDMSKGWYAGCQYDGDVAAAKKVLANLGKYYPGAKKYEVAGFFWWQGDKDMRNAAHYERYGKNLVQLIRALRKDFNAPEAKFVTASLGQTKMGSKRGDGKILDAMASVAKSDQPDLKGKVAFVYTHPLSKGGSSSGHYGGNPETYMNVGEAMGKAMVGLLKASKKAEVAKKKIVKKVVVVPESLKREGVSRLLRPAIKGLESRRYSAVLLLLGRVEKLNQKNLAKGGGDRAGLEAEAKDIETIRVFIDGQVDKALEEINGFVAVGNLYRANQVITQSNRYFGGIKKYSVPVGKLQRIFLKPDRKAVILEGSRFYQLLAYFERTRSAQTVEQFEKFAKGAGDSVYGKAATAVVEALKKDGEAELDGDALVAGGNEG